MAEGFQLILKLTHYLRHNVLGCAKYLNGKSFYCNIIIRYCSPFMLFHSTYRTIIYTKDLFVVGKDMSNHPYLLGRAGESNEREQ